MNAAGWSNDAIAHVQDVLDRSAATATPEVGRVFARPDWRLGARDFLEMWSGQRWCTIASVGPQGQPHIAVVHADFQPDGRLTMRMFTGSVRARDIQTNDRVALSKDLDGAVAMVYGRARRVPGTEAVRQDSETVEVEVQVRRIYAMRPRSA
ncbi:MAG: pyridoxamine 5'-phosphate oxidase family protein [Dehalococcoidia bacterium]